MMAKSIAALSLLSLLVLAGCDKEEFSRYPSVAVPGFTAADYIRDLSNPDPEVVYNAICNIGGDAQDIGRTLCDEKADTTSEKYSLAKEAYGKIRSLLQADDPQIVAASLRFLQLFSADYKPRAELVEPVCQIKNEHPLVQFEQIAALGKCVGDTTIVPAPLLRRLLDSPSWVASRSSYGLINKLADESLRGELVKRYRATADEKERLLLLTAFGHRPGPVEIELIEQELLATDSVRIRQAACGLLTENLQSPGVVAWLADNYQRLQPDLRQMVFHACAKLDTEGGADLACRLLEQGQVPDDGFLRTLSDLLEKEPDNHTACLKRVEQTVRARPELAARLEGVREKMAKVRARYVSMRQEYEPISREFIGKARELLNKYNVPAEKQEQFFKTVANPEQFGVQNADEADRK